MKKFKFKYVGNEPIQANKGEAINIWGHQFIWDGESAICEMNEEARAAIESEIKHGRPYKILASVSPRAKKPAPAGTPMPEKDDK